jgi:hypothetical protein
MLQTLFLRCCEPCSRDVAKTVLKMLRTHILKMLRTHILKMLRLLTPPLKTLKKVTINRATTIHLRRAKYYGPLFLRYSEPCLIHTFEGIVEYVCPQSVEDRFLISKGCQLIIRRVEAAVEGESTPFPINWYTYVASCTSKYKRDTQDRDRAIREGIVHVSPTCSIVVEKQELGTKTQMNLSSS